LTPEQIAKISPIVDKRQRATENKYDETPADASMKS